MRYLKVYENFRDNINIESESLDEFKTSFVIDGDEYWFSASNEDKVFPEHIRYGWHLSFGFGSGDSKYLPTNKGNHFEVFSSVKKSLDLFMNKYSPNKISFISEGESKSNIYLGILDKYGYEVNSRDSKLDSLTGEIPILYMLDK